MNESPNFNLYLLSCQTAKLLNFRKRNHTAFAPALTMADRRSSRFHILSCALAFTMAEILISLTIIGVIAAITLPALQANINESAWKAQRKALYSRMSQAISMMPSLNGYGTYAGSWSDNSVNVTDDTAAQAFVTDGLSKVLQISNICSIPLNASSENARIELKKCGIPSQITTMTNKTTGTTAKINFPTKLSELNNTFTGLYINSFGVELPNTNPQKFIDTRIAAFVTKNGESVAVFYNPYCLNLDNVVNIAGKWHIQPLMCANFIYDLNGLKGPNKMGKDIGFITAMYPTDSEVLAPLPLDKNAQTVGAAQYATAPAICRKQDKDSRVPNKEETIAMFYNKKLLGIADDIPQFITNSLYSDTESWKVEYFTALLYHDSRDYSGYLRCIKR